MAKQTRPFIVEIRSSRKPKTASEKPSIWGSLNLKPDPDLDMPSDPGPMGDGALVGEVGRS